MGRRWIPRCSLHYLQLSLGRHLVSSELLSPAQLFSIPRALVEGVLVSHQAVTTYGLLAPLCQQRGLFLLHVLSHPFSHTGLPLLPDKAQLLGLAFKTPCV